MVICLVTNIGLCPQQFYRHIHAIIRSRQIFYLFIYSIKIMLDLNANLVTESYDSTFLFKNFTRLPRANSEQLKF